MFYNESNVVGRFPHSTTRVSTLAGGRVFIPGGGL
jgi:hypothetical protein